MHAGTAVLPVDCTFTPLGPAAAGTRCCCPSPCMHDPPPVPAEVSSRHHTSLCVAVLNFHAASMSLCSTMRQHVFSVSSVLLCLEAGFCHNQLRAASLAHPCLGRCLLVSQSLQAFCCNNHHAQCIGCLFVLFGTSEHTTHLLLSTLLLQSSPVTKHAPSSFSFLLSVLSLFSVMSSLFRARSYIKPPGSGLFFLVKGLTKHDERGSSLSLSISLSGLTDGLCVDAHSCALSSVVQFSGGDHYIFSPTRRPNACNDLLGLN